MAVIDLTPYTTLNQKIAAVAQVTGNPKMDVGYQFFDECPFFRFSGGHYTILHPDRANGNYTVDVYQKVTNHTFSDGSVGDYMQRMSNVTGTQNGGTLSISGSSYSYQGMENIRLHKINIWALNKPTPGVGLVLGTLSEDARRLANYGLSIEPARSITELMTNLQNNSFINRFDFVPRSTAYARLLDFQGYNTASSEWYPPTATLDLSPNRNSVNVADTMTFSNPRGFGFFRNLGTVQTAQGLSASSLRPAFVILRKDGSSWVAVGYRPSYNFTGDNQTYFLPLGKVERNSQGIVTLHEKSGLINYDTTYKIFLVATNFTGGTELDWTAWNLLSTEGSFFWCLHRNPYEFTTDIYIAPPNPANIFIYVSSSYISGYYTSSPYATIDNFNLTIGVRHTINGERGTGGLVNIEMQYQTSYGWVTLKTLSVIIPRNSDASLTFTKESHETMQNVLTVNGNMNVRFRVENAVGTIGEYTNAMSIPVTI